MNDLERRLAGLSPEKRELLLRRLGRSSDPSSTRQARTQEEARAQAESRPHDESGAFDEAGPRNEARLHDESGPLDSACPRDPRRTPDPLRTPDHDGAPEASCATRAAGDGAFALPLTPEQERLWLMDRLEPGNPAYQLAIGFRVIGPLDVFLYERAAAALVARHQPLRTTYTVVRGRPIQIVHPTGTLDFRLVEPTPSARAAGGAASDARLDAAVAAGIRAAFAERVDLERGPVFRLGVTSLSPDRHVVVASLHHIAGDGWSVRVLFHELGIAYGALARGEPVPLPPLALPYADYVRRLRDHVESDAVRRQVAWWTQRLDRLPPSGALPSDRPRPSAQSLSGTRVPFEWPVSACTRYVTLAHDEGVTPFMVFLAGLVTVLHRWSGADDLVVGTPVAGRDVPGSESLIGLLANVVAIRIDASGDPSFRGLVARVRDAALAAYANQDAPLARVIEAVAPARTGAATPAFQVMLSHLPPTGDLGFEGLRVEELDLESDTAMLDLGFILRETADGIRGYIEASTDLWRRSTIRAVAASYRAVLEQAVDDPLKPISAFSLAGGLAPEPLPAAPRRQAFGSIVVASSTPVESLAAPLAYWNEHLGLAQDVQVAPFGQVIRQLVDPHSELSRNTGGVNVVLVTPEDLVAGGTGGGETVPPPALAEGSGEGRPAVATLAAGHGHGVSRGDGAASGLAREDGRERVVPAGARAVDELAAEVQAWVNRTGVPTVVCLSPHAPDGSSGTVAQDHVDRIAGQLESMLGSAPGVSLVLPAEFDRLYPVPVTAPSDGPATSPSGAAAPTDGAATTPGHAALTPSGLATAPSGAAAGDDAARARFRAAAVATMIARTVARLRTAPAKLLVLDADQTLWQGVCAEDGPDGVVIDAPRLALQRAALRLQDAGVLLGLCSRNEEADVAAVFDRHPDMPLRLDRFAARRIDWRPKSESIRSIAEQLAFGLDAIVVLDDDPVVCAEIERRCPGVLAVPLPPADEDVARVLDHVWSLDRIRVTDDDRRREERYREEGARQSLRRAATTMGEFLAGLDLQVRIEPLAPGQLGRASQLTWRTTQFNAAGRRRSEAELARDAAEVTGAAGASGAPLCHGVSVRDRFGDYGLVGVVAARAAGDAFVVETFLLSCRALGRGVEHRMVAELQQHAARLGLARIEIPVVRTARNTPVREFLASVGTMRPESGGHSAVCCIELAPEVTVFSSEARAAGDAGLSGDPGGPWTDDTGPDGAANDGGRDLSRRSEAGSRAGRATGVETASGTPGDPMAPGEARRRADLVAIATSLNRVESIDRAVRAWQPWRVRGATGRRFVAPRTPTEEQVAAVWAEVLRVDRIGAEDGFFDLGGHSMLAAEVVARIAEVSGVTLPLGALFETPTVAAVAAAIDRSRERDRARDGASGEADGGDSGADDAAGRAAGAPPDLEAAAWLDPFVRPPAGCSLRPPEAASGHAAFTAVVRRSGDAGRSPAGTLPGVAAPGGPDRILLTGATGFVGAFLLDALVETTGAEIFCLVRAASPSAGRDRIDAARRRYGLGPPDWANRVVAVPGDLGQSGLGLGDEAARWLSARIDAIVHAGAEVNFVRPYAALAAANVDGTRHLLRLACAERGIPFHHVSTLGVFGVEGDGVFGEDDLPRRPPSPAVGYFQSKWVAERLVTEGRRRGLPAAIYRLGAVTAHSVTGVGGAGDLAAEWLRAVVRTGAAPDLDVAVDMTPVDFVAAAIARLVARGVASASVYHLCQPRRVSLRDAIDAVRGAGVAVDVVPVEQWIARAAAGASGGGAAAPSWTMRAIAEAGWWRGMTADRFDCRRTAEALAALGIACPPVDARLVAPWLRRLRGEAAGAAAGPTSST